jgi:hypothetical protein
MRIKSLLENLKDKTMQDLNAIARKYGLSGYSKLDKRELVKFVRRKLKSLASGKAKPKKKARTKKTPGKRKAGGRTAKPRTRDKTRSKTRKKSSKRAGEGGMVLLPRDPEWLYVYWDLTVQQETLLRTSGVPTLRLMGHPDRRELKRIPLSPGAKSWHVQASTADRDYVAELGVVDWRGVFRPLLASNPASTPPAEVSGNFQAVFGEFKTAASPRPSSTPSGADLEKAERLGKLSFGKESDADSASSHDVLRRK